MRTTRVVAAGAGVAAASLLLGWPAWAAVNWLRYGHPARRRKADDLLDEFLPSYEAGERHDVRVRAPASVTWAVLHGVALQQSALVRGIVRSRELLLGVRDADPWPAGGVVMQMRATGWSVLAERPGREIVLGTATQPWRGKVTFRSLASGEFEAFDRPGFVKIVTALAVEPLRRDLCRLRTETRVVTTDAAARRRFRRYWAAFSPGIGLIRRASLGIVRREAERRYRASREHAVAHGRLA